MWEIAKRIEGMKTNRERVFARGFEIFMPRHRSEWIILIGWMVFIRSIFFFFFFFGFVFPCGDVTLRRRNLIASDLLLDCDTWRIGGGCALRLGTDPLTLWSDLIFVLKWNDLKVPLTNFRYNAPHQSTSSTCLLWEPGKSLILTDHIISRVYIKKINYNKKKIRYVTVWW